uniref:Rab11 family-interacting protein 3-like n=1 Tax=Gouania willdenowi TaxID=441366 RepID=A0A8C5EGL0_GOUWI
MEPTVVSGPLGHSQWESEKTFPLGFQTLETDNGSDPHSSKTGQTGFRNGDHQDQMSQQNEEDRIFTNKSVVLESLLDVSNFSCGDLQFKGDCTVSLCSTERADLSCTEKREGLDENTESTLSWLFSPNFSYVIGETIDCKELSSIKDSSPETSVVLNDQTEPTSLSVQSHSGKFSERTAETIVDSFLLVDHPPITPESLGESKSPGVSEESREEQVAPLVTVSPETRDKGPFPAQMTDLLCGSALQCLPENCFQPNLISTPEGFEGSVPLLDSEVPDSDSSQSLCPVSPASVICTDELLKTSSEDIHLIHAANTSQQCNDHDSPAPGFSEQPSSLTPLADDVLSRGDHLCERSSVEKVSTDLMEDVCSEAKKQAEEEMALDQCLTVKEVHDEDPWDVEPQEKISADPSAEREEESLKDTGQPEGLDCREEISLDFSSQDLHTSTTDVGWTSQQTIETVSLSKMVEDDSLPMVSVVNTREEDVSPLKAVFDALDQDGDGFVRIEEFMEFAAAYGADQVKDLTKFLDPSCLGVISFEDFHRGITAISNGGPEPKLYSANYSPGDGAVGCPEEYDEQNEVTDSAYLGSESTYSECETFTDEDTGALVPPEMHEDVETDSGIEATLHDPEDGGNRFSLNSELHNHSLVTVISGEEEHFEDFGESNTSELLVESSVDGHKETGDLSVNQTHEQLNGSSLLSPSAGKRLSSKKVARHLLQNSSMTLDTMSDLTRDILELADNDITDKMLLLERRVAELEKESEASVEQHARLRQDNLHLVHRANALEEQLKEQEVLADEQQQQETRRHKEALNKMERERGLELENMQARLQQLDEENSELRSCVPCLRANIERLEEEKTKLMDETEAMSDRLQDEIESRRKMADKLNHERHQNQKEKESTQELIEDLRKQLEHLQLYKLEAEAKRGRSPGAGLQEYQTRTREAELEQEIKRLKQDNRALKEQNDELNGQIINLSIQGAKNLMTASFSDSLAAEINSVSRTELMEAVHKQEEINYRLQDYIDKIIVAIMECNPSILEVK